jgi:hypothetical protein
MTCRILTKAAQNQRSPCCIVTIGRYGSDGLSLPYCLAQPWLRMMEGRLWCCPIDRTVQLGQMMTWLAPVVSRMEAQNPQLLKLAA